MTTPKLAAPELTSGQALPESTVNEQVRTIEQGAGHFIFKDRDLATPPGSPAQGDCYLVATSGTGAWAGQDGKIAFYMNTGWEFITAIEGFTAWVNDENVLIVFDGAAWIAAGGGGASLSVVTTMSGTAETLLNSHKNTFLRFTNAAAKTLTIQDEVDEALDTDYEVHIRNVGAGDLTLVEDTAVTITPPDGGSLVIAAGGTATLKRSAADAFDLMGQVEGVAAGADDVGFTPAGNIAATDVQAAIEELDTEKFPYTGGALTGATSITDSGVGDLFSVTRSDAAKTFSLDFSGGVGNFDINATPNWLTGSGLFLVTTNRTDATQKDGRLGVPHYTNSEEPFLFGLMSSTSVANAMSLGGGSSLGNAATSIDFLTAANNTTPTGTKRGGVTSAGDLTWGSGSDVALDANRLFRLRPYTVGTLPTVGTADRMAVVTDATAPTYLGTLTGGGAVRCPVYDNGTAWVSS